MGWTHGAGIDWLGLVIQEVDGRRIETYLREEIFEPLGMVDTDTRVDRLRDRLSACFARTDEGIFDEIELMTDARGILFPAGPAPSARPCGRSQKNACSPVCARPSISACTSCVPSYVLTVSRFCAWRMMW